MSNNSPAWLLIGIAIWAILMYGLVTEAFGDTLLPIRKLTPGATNHSVTQSNIGRTICKDGWTATVRPPLRFTNQVKLRLLPEYGHHTDSPLSFELDHLIPLELGGAPSDDRNLWPQPYVGQWGARKKDVLEKKLNRMVCSGTITLKQAQSAISTNWVAAYKHYVPTLSKVQNHVLRRHNF